MLSKYRAELKRLFALAVPLAAAQAGTQMMSVVDIAVLGRVGGLELAASGLGNAVFFAISIFGIGVCMGVDPLISQAIGAGDHVRARAVMWQGVWLASIISGVMTIPLVISPLLFPMIGVQRELIEPATTYLLIRIAGLLPWYLFMIARAYLQAHHVTRPLLVAMIVANVFNLGADILLVFGGGILPEWCGPLRAIPAMGVAGAALATVAGQILQLAIVVLAIRKIRLPDAVRVSRRWNGPEVARAFQVGWPVASQMTAEVGVFALVALLAGRLGTLDLAAHQLVISLASFTFTIALGVAAAGSVRVGLAVGARNAEATRIAGHAAFMGGVVVMSSAALLFITMPRILARVITDVPAVINAAVPLFFVAAIFQISDGIQAVGSGVLRGAADTRYPFVVNLIGHWLIGFPIAMFLGFKTRLGVVGLWWGLCAGLTAVAVLLVRRFLKLSSRPFRRLQVADEE